jgi:hypothetical protein
MSDALRDSILEILEINRDDLKSYGVESISLFGSVARGDAGPRSDVDLLVDLKPGTTLFGFVRLKNHLQDLLGLPVDLVMRDGLRKEFRERVFAEEIRAA